MGGTGGHSSNYILVEIVVIVFIVIHERTLKSSFQKLVGTLLLAMGHYFHGLVSSTGSSSTNFSAYFFLKISLKFGMQLPYKEDYKRYLLCIHRIVDVDFIGL